MELFKDLSDVSILGLADFFKDLRNYHGFTMGEISAKMEKDFGLDVSENLIGKIERKESKMQLAQFLAFCFIYRIDLKDIAPEIFRYSQDSQTKLIQEYSRNPEFQNIIDLLLPRLEDFSLILYIKNFIKNTFHLYEKRESSSILKVANPNSTTAKRKKSNS